MSSSIVVSVALVSSSCRLFQVRVWFVYNVSHHYYITMDNVQVVTGTLYFGEILSYYSVNPFNYLLSHFLTHSVDILPMDQSSSGQCTCVSFPLVTWANSCKSLCVSWGIGDCSICTESKVDGEVFFTSDLSLLPSQPFSFHMEFYSFALKLCNVCFVIAL